MQILKNWIGPVGASICLAFGVAGIMSFSLRTARAESEKGVAPAQVFANRFSIANHDCKFLQFSDADRRVISVIHDPDCPCRSVKFKGF